MTSRWLAALTVLGVLLIALMGVFAPGVEWKDQPPAPSFWMHQLYSVDPKNAFDSKALATEAQRLLK